MTCDNDRNTHTTARGYMNKGERLLSFYFLPLPNIRLTPFIIKHHRSFARCAEQRSRIVGAAVAFERCGGDGCFADCHTRSIGGCDVNGGCPLIGSTPMA